MSLLADAIGEAFPESKDENQEVTNETGDTGEVQQAENENLEQDTTVEAVVEEENTSDELDFVSEEETTTEETTEAEAKPNESIADEFLLGDKPTVDVSSYTDGEFESIEDLVSEYKALKENTLSSENVFEQFEDQAQEKFGLSFNEVISWKNTDYTSMNEWDVLTEYEQMRDPDVTDSEIENELYQFDILKKSEAEIAEMIEDGELTDREYKGIQSKFSRKVRAARQELSEFRDNLNFDDFKVSSQRQEVYKPTQEEIDANMKQMQQELNSLTKLRMNLGGKDSPVNLDFNVSDEERSNLLNTLSNQNWLVDRWANEDGSINKNKAYRDSYILMNHSKMIKSAYSEGLARGAKQTVVNEDNITLGNGKSQSSGTSVDPLQKMADTLNNYF